MAQNMDQSIPHFKYGQKKISTFLCCRMYVILRQDIYQTYL